MIFRGALPPLIVFEITLKYPLFVCAPGCAGPVESGLCQVTVGLRRRLRPTPGDPRTQGPSGPFRPFLPVEPGPVAHPLLGGGDEPSGAGAPPPTSEARYFAPATLRAPRSPRRGFLGPVRAPRPAPHAPAARGRHVRRDVLGGRLRTDDGRVSVHGAPGFRRDPPFATRGSGPPRGRERPSLASRPYTRDTLRTPK